MYLVLSRGVNLSSTSCVSRSNLYLVLNIERHSIGINLFIPSNLEFIIYVPSILCCYTVIHWEVPNYC